MKPLAFRSVHWYSAEEWKKVYHLIFDPGSDEVHKREALNILLVWKSRDPQLPSAIESTLGLLEVDLQRPEDIGELQKSDRLLRMMYSSVITRFINHTCDQAQTKRSTLFKAADDLEIPRWIVDLRHEMAHGHELPSLVAMRKAVYEAMNWLYLKYWKPQSENISSYVVTPHSNDFKENVYKLFGVHNILAVCAYPDFNLKDIKSIADVELKADITNDLKIILKNEFNKKKTFRYFIKKVVNVINNCVVDYKDYASKKYIINVMIDEDSSFLSDIINKKGGSKLVLPDNWFIIWQPILTMMHKNDLIHLLVKELLNLINKNEEPTYRRNKAAHWIKEIFIGLDKCNQFRTLFDVAHENNKNKTHSELKKMLVKENPSLNRGLTLDLLHPIPLELVTVNFLEECLRQFNPYLNVYIKELMVIIRPKLHKTHIKKIMTLIEISTCNNNVKSVQTDNIYTIDDLKSSDVEMDFVRSDEDLLESETWQLYKGNCDWESCPIGMLPWQSNTNNNPLL